MFDFDFVAAEQPGVIAVAMRTSFAELNSFVFFFAIIAPGYRWDDVDFHLTAPEHVFLVGRPTPAVGEQVRHHRRNLANIHHHRGNMLHMVFLRHLLDVLDDIKDDT